MTLEEFSNSEWRTMAKIATLDLDSSYKTESGQDLR
jgi:hypothetical protein